MEYGREEANPPEKRFQKDFKFYENYNKFMEEIISKGYAREAKSNSPDGRTWYLPHHGACHPHKPSKIRVVFDCSTELNVSSINEELLTGPDLANKLVGILTKFRENKVAVMTDIEKMYFQIFLAEQHRSYFDFYDGRKLISQRSQLIMRCVSIYLEVFHLEPAGTTL